MTFTPNTPEIMLPKAGRDDLHSDPEWILRLPDNRKLRLSDTLHAFTVEPCHVDLSETVELAAPETTAQRSFLVVEAKVHRPWIVTCDDGRVVQVIGVDGPACLEAAALYFGVVLDAVGGNILASYPADGEHLARWRDAGCPTIVDSFDYHDAKWRDESAHA